MPTTSEGSESGAMIDPSLVFAEYFDSGVAPAWPAPWVELGGLLDHYVDGDGRGRLVGEVTTVGRIAVPGIAEVDVEVCMTVTFDDWDSQGVGIYVRQNGGWLQNTVPHGQGYGVFLEGNDFDELGIWRELDGIEQVPHNIPMPALLDGVPYRIRFRCEQSGGVTLLRARIWPAADPEPVLWDITYNDDSAVLQNQPGSVALDMYNYGPAQGIYFDDIEVRTVP